MKITLRQLGYLTAFAETHHFGRAAERAGVSQPALSAQLRELEGQLGGVLIARDTPGLPLTPLGREVLAHARRVLAEVRGLTETVRRATEGKVSVRIGVIPTVAPYIVPPLVPLAEQDGAHLAIREAVTETLVDDLNAGKLDAAVIALPAPSGFAALPVVEDPLLLAMPPAALAPDMVVPARADQIDASRLLLLDREHCLSEQTLLACRVRPDTASLRLGTASLGTLARLVATGQGVMLMPEMAASVEGRDLRIARFGAAGPRRQIALIGHGGVRDQGWFTRLALLLAEAARAIPRPDCAQRTDAAGPLGRAPRSPARRPAGPAPS
jgi:LysR family transcriptional regulator, hydrogen peroxide-inducible genes activator